MYNPLYLVEHTPPTGRTIYGIETSMQELECSEYGSNHNWYKKQSAEMESSQERQKAIAHKG